MGEWGARQQGTKMTEHRRGQAHLLFGGKHVPKARCLTQFSTILQQLTLLKVNEDKSSVLRMDTLVSEKTNEGSPSP